MIKYLISNQQPPIPKSDIFEGINSGEIFIMDCAKQPYILLCKDANNIIQSKYEKKLFDISNSKIIYIENLYGGKPVKVTSKMKTVPIYTCETTTIKDFIKSNNKQPFYFNVFHKDFDNTDIYYYDGADIPLWGCYESILCFNLTTALIKPVNVNAEITIRDSVRNISKNIDNDVTMSFSVKSRLVQRLVKPLSKLQIGDTFEIDGQNPTVSKHYGVNLVLHSNEKFADCLNMSSNEIHRWSLNFIANPVNIELDIYEC